MMLFHAFLPRDSVNLNKNLYCLPGIDDLCSTGCTNSETKHYILSLLIELQVRPVAEGTRDNWRNLAELCLQYFGGK